MTRPPSPSRLALALLSAGLWLAGCAASGPAVHDAAPVVPSAWRASPAGDADLDERWWRSFGSDELDALVVRAGAGSQDVAAAFARVRQADAQLRIDGAGLYPVASATLDAGRQSRLGGHTDVAGTSFAAGLSASYELDFWGGQAARRDAARARRQSAAFDRDTVRLSVTAAVATAWLQAVATRERIGIGEENLRNARRLLELVESRARAGAATPLELAQQRGLAATQARLLAALRQQSDDARTALAVLLGDPATVSGLTVEQRSLEALVVPSVGAGLPSALLPRRPDVARAEARLAAADADIMVARAAMLPGVTLGAGLGTGGDRLGRLFDNPVFTVAAGLAAPIFNAGRLAAGRDLSVARREELLAEYRAVLIAAFADVETALTAVAGIDTQRAAQDVELAEARRAASFAESRYRAGAETLLTLLDAQRTLYAAQDLSVQLKAQRLQSAVALYKALGGGWVAGTGDDSASRAAAR